MLKQCPICTINPMAVTRVSCGSCDLHMEGEIHMPPLARLAGEEMRLAEALVLAGGNLKQVASEIGVSYPTLRKRLDELVARLSRERQDDERKVEDILARVEAGEVDADAGIRKIREIRHDL